MTQKQSEAAKNSPLHNSHHQNGADNPNWNKPHPRRIDLTGKKIGKLTVLGSITNPGAKKLKWKCLCDCGNITYVISDLLNSERTKSCGCYLTEWKRIEEPRIVSSKRVFSSYQNVHGGNLTYETFFKLCQQPCHYCGAPPSNIHKKNKKFNRSAEYTFIYSGLDRIDSTKEHDEDNVVPCCKICNYAKHNLTYIEFKEWAKNLYSNFVKGEI